MSLFGKIILGILTREREMVNLPIKRLAESWGEEEAKSETIPFTFSNYYEEEMGRDLLRLWVSFRNLFPVAEMVKLKIKTIAIEKEYRNEKGGRLFNLDPGILTLSNFCLLTHKNYAHRIYLGEGIFGELTLLYKRGRMEALPWTYPDYQTETALKFFLNARKRLKEDLNLPRKNFPL